MHGSMEHTSDEELLRYVHKNFLEDTKEDVENIQKFTEENHGPIKGEIAFNNIDPVTYGTMNDDGSVVLSHTTPAQPSRSVKTGATFALLRVRNLRTRS